MDLDITHSTPTLLLKTSQFSAESFEISTIWLVEFNKAISISRLEPHPSHAHETIDYDIVIIIVAYDVTEL